MAWYSFYYKGQETNVQVNKKGDVRKVPKDWMKCKRPIYLAKKQISEGYFKISVLVKDYGMIGIRLHQVLAAVFLGHEINGHEYVIDHKNENKLDNRLSNLRIVSNRENSTKTFKHKNKKLGYRKNGNGYMSRICYKSNQVYLGTYKTKKEASAAYQEALRKINAGEFAVN